MIAIWIPLALAAVAVVYFLLDKLTSCRTNAGEMALLLRRVDLRLLEDLLDPQTEARLRSELSARAFRRVQRGRILAAREQIGRIRHNAAIFLRWSTDECEKLDGKNRAQFGDREQLVIAVVKSADEVRASAMRALLKLAIWRLCLLHLWSILPSPSLSDVREVLGADLLAGYEALISSAGELVLAGNAVDYDLVRTAL